MPLCGLESVHETRHTPDILQLERPPLPILPLAKAGVGISMSRSGLPSYPGGLLSVSAGVSKCGL